MQQFWSRVAESPRIVVDFATGKFFEDLPWALAAMGISCAGVVVALVFIKLTEMLTRARSTDRFLYDGNEFYQTSHRSSKSLIRLAGMSLAILSVVFGFWIAASTLGVNFWTLILAYGIVGVVLTYTFGSVLKNIGAFLALALSIKIDEGAVVTVGTIRGRIKAIHILWVEMQDMTDLEQRITSKPATPGYPLPPKEIYVPTWQFIEAVVYRDYEAQKNIETLLKERPYKWGNIKYPVTFPAKKILLW